MKHIQPGKGGDRWDRTLTISGSGEEKRAKTHCITKENKFFSIFFFIIYLLIVTKKKKKDDLPLLGPLYLFVFFIYLLLQKDLIFFFLFWGSAALGFPHVLPLNASRASTTKGRFQGKVNVFLGIQTNNKRRNIHHLLPNPGIKIQT